MAEAATTAAPAATKHVTLRGQFCDTWNRVDSARAADRPKCGKCGKPMLLDRPFSLNEDTFTRTIQDSEIPIMVDFYADWCGPCKVMAPAVDEVAAAYLGRALVAKLDTERAQRTSSSFNIRGIPTTIVFKAGKEVARQTGAVPKPVLVKMMEEALKG
jgi:thioredoxin 2